MAGYSGGDQHQRRFSGLALLPGKPDGQSACGLPEQGDRGGQADNATTAYGGNRIFLYKHNEGQFQVLVPLHNATFAFQPGWPALKNLDIELNFLNDGLWMKSDSVALGGVTATNLTANIPDYSKETAD